MSSSFVLFMCVNHSLKSAFKIHFIIYRNMPRIQCKNHKKKIGTMAKKPHWWFSTNGFLPPTAWWWRLRGAEGAARSERWNQDGPSLCWPQTCLCLVSSGPTLDPWHEAQVRGWAWWGSGHSPRSAGRPGRGEKRPVWSSRKNWREVKRNCRKGELLLWIWSYWGMSGVLELISLPCP